MLLSQERVLALLYDKTFPVKQDQDPNEVKKEEDSPIVGN